MLKIKFFLIFLFLGNIVFAQTEGKIELNIQDSILQKNYFPINDLFDYKYELHKDYNRQFSSVLFQDIPNSHIQPNMQNGLKTIVFGQNRTENIFPLLGNIEHLSSGIIFRVSDRITAKTSMGLVKQNTSLSAFTPNYQISLYSSLEYAITDWLSAYFYGQYLSPSISAGKTYFDPLLYMNTTFLQTEIGTGLRAEHKNIKLDVGVSKMYDTQYKVSNPIGTMDTKLIIGF